MRISSALIVLLAVLMSGCQLSTPRDAPVQGREFDWRDVGKSDIDMVAEVSLRQSDDYLRELAVKLYRRNPAQRRLSTHPNDTPERAAARLIAARINSANLGALRSSSAIEKAFDPTYSGDRVAAFIFGLRSMMVDAYGGEGEFFLSQTYDPQKLHYLARNVEVAAWQLRSKRDSDGRLFLLSGGQDARGVINHSYERLFGKLIAVHDHFSHVVADTTNRRIKNVIQGVASAVFFPI